MTAALLVPVNLDVLRLPRRTTVGGPLLDFERLPWSSRAWGRDVNADTPFLASAIANPPFGGTQRVLEAGFHLHWALPDALCRGILDSTTGKTSFPAVPNRWLITRVLNGAETRWVVESDYVWPKLEDWLEDRRLPQYRWGMSVTLLAHDLQASEQPFQHIGRAYSWLEWRETFRPSPLASGKLTAVGYGDAMFAAYHPHCHSVFGFSDAWDGAAEVPEEIEYRVVGWYSDPKQDPLMGLEAAWESDMRINPTWTLASHKWKVQTNHAPQRTLCFASNQVRASITLPNKPNVAIVANTGSEALSTLLAAELSQDLPTRAKIEDQLEAMQLRIALNSRDADLMPRLQAARHERTFRPHAGVPQWQVTVADSTVEMPSELMTALGEGIRTLNMLEDERHTRQVEHRVAKQSLYADWCKYMTTAYHHPDERPPIEIDVIKDYIERTHLRKHRPDLGPVILEKESDIAKLTTSIESSIDKLRKQIQDFQNSQIAQGQRTAADPIPWRIEQVPGPRFWTPNDPVILMTGGGIRATERHGQDGRGQADGHLACLAMDIVGDPWAAKKPDFTLVDKSLEARTNIDPSRCTGFQQSDGRPNHPIFLEWSADLFRSEDSRQPIAQGHYPPDVIVHNYDIPPRAIDLQPKVGTEIAADPDRHDGRNFLSPHTSNTLFGTLRTVIQEQILDRYAPLQNANNSPTYQGLLATWHAEAKGSPFYPADSVQLGRHRFDPAERAALKAWYSRRPLGPNGTGTLASLSVTKQFDDPMWTAICAFDGLHDEEGRRREFLSASLDGLNDQLLGLTKSAILPIDEPIGFDSYRAFSQSIGSLTGRTAIATPEPNAPFSPIRCGELEMAALRIVDSFGQSLDLEPTRLLGPARYVANSRQGALYLPPRIIPPMHVSFRWLDAAHSNAEFIQAPGGEVICGWVIPNVASESIAVFGPSGTALGLLTIDRDADYVEWVPAPGQPTFAHEHSLNSRERDVLQMNAAIGNGHLRRVIQHIWSAPTSYLRAFIDTLADAQENIDPRGSNEYSCSAMLMGRPLAIARAELDILPLEGTLARTDWRDFERRIHGERPTDDGFTRVRFPLRVGDYRQLDDGLAGYWIEHPDGSFVDRCFHAQAADDVAGLGSGVFPEGYKIEAHAQKPDDGLSLQRFQGRTVNIRQTISDPALLLTIIFDPRGVVHLTTGILPTKTIDVPASQFVKSLEKIESWREIGPLVTRKGMHDLPLPSDVEYDVVWRESAWTKTDSGADDQLVWNDLRATPTILRNQVLEGIATLGISISLEQLVERTWLAQIDANDTRFRLLPKEERGKLPIGETSSSALANYLEQNALQLAPLLTMAAFDTPVEVREGWLVLQRSAK